MMYVLRPNRTDQLHLYNINNLIWPQICKAKPLQIAYQMGFTLPLMGTELSLYQQKATHFWNFYSCTQCVCVYVCVCVGGRGGDGEAWYCDI